MGTPANLAAWIEHEKADLEVKEAPYPTIAASEIIIKNEAICVQHFDAQIRHDAYIKSIPYPFILGSTIAGTVVQVGPDATSSFAVGDRVTADTAAYKRHETRNGAWQRYVVADAGWTTKIGDAPFDQAVALGFALQTAIGALVVYLDMPQVHPGVPPPAERADEKVLIWGAGGAVGGYAVQYAKSAGYTVVVTASPRGAAHLKAIGASEVVDYKDPKVVDILRGMGPFKYLYTTSGDAASQTALSLLLQPHGGKFASTLALKTPEPLDSNVEMVYEFFGNVTQKEGKQFETFREWWYGEYLGAAVAGAVEPTAFEKRPGGLWGIQKAADDTVEGRTKVKLVLNPQEE